MTKTRSLVGATVVITGASSGIGAAATRAFAATGANVVLAARSHTLLKHVAATLPGSPLVVPTDIANESAAHNLIAQTIATYGTLDILINNAGIGITAPIAELSIANLQQVFAVNVYGTLATIQAALPHMHQQHHGHIINVSSVVSKHALPYAGGYAASKAALDRITEALRMELYGTGIAVSLLLPGTTHTEFANHRLGHGREIRRMVPNGVSPDVVARALVRVAHTQARVAYVTRRDALQVIAALVAPMVVERLLPWAFRWQRN